MIQLLKRYKKKKNASSEDNNLHAESLGVEKSLSSHVSEWKIWLILHDKPERTLQNVVDIGTSIGLQFTNLFSVLSRAGTKPNPVLNANVQEKIDNQVITVGSKEC